MENWYLPITILPGVGLLLMSTSNLVNSLSSEIARLVNEDTELLCDIIDKKINQLSLLNRSMVGFYISAACFVLAGLSGGVGINFSFHIETFISAMMIFGIACVLISLVFLTIYSYRAVSIKREQFKKILNSK
ncbi:MAG: DUF2721 domain-containing protein [Bacteroidota bacterium]